MGPKVVYVTRRRETGASTPLVRRLLPHRLRIDAWERARRTPPGQHGFTVNEAKRQCAKVRSVSKSFASLAVKLPRDHVYLRIERVPPRVLALRFEDVEEEVAMAPERAGRIREAHAVLPAGVAAFRPRVDEGEELPAAGRWIGPGRRGGVEVRGRTVAGVDVVELRSARIGVPGVGVDGGDVNRRVEVEAEATAPGVGVEEEIRARLVLDDR